jgi:hypothetical protein
VLAQAELSNPCEEGRKDAERSGAERDDFGWTLALCKYGREQTAEGSTALLLASVPSVCLSIYLERAKI